MDTPEAKLNWIFSIYDADDGGRFQYHNPDPDPNADPDPDADPDADPDTDANDILHLRWGAGTLLKHCLNIIICIFIYDDGNRF